MKFATRPTSILSFGFACALSLAVISQPAHAARKKAKPVVESESNEVLPPKLVVDTSGEENKMDKAVFEKAQPTKDIAKEAGLELPAAGVTAAAQGSATSDAAAKAAAGLDVDAALAQAKKEAASRLPENEIPVLTKMKDEKKEVGGGLTRIFVTLGVLLAAFGAASFGLKRWSARSPNGKSDTTKIRVLTQHHLGPKKTLAIIQVAGESILIGITDQNIAMIKTLSLIDDEVPVDVPNSFAGAMTDVEFEDDLDGDMDVGGGNFALRGLSEIRDVVSNRLGKGRS